MALWEYMLIDGYSMLLFIYLYDCHSCERAGRQLLIEQKEDYATGNKFSSWDVGVVNE